MILVTGATGNLGKSTIEFLLKKGVAPNNIAALVRNEDKAIDLKDKGIRIRIGDYDNYQQLVEAFTGIDQLLLISGSDIINRAKQQENAVKAAKEAGVKHILYTSFERKNETDASPIHFVAASHIATEALIKQCGLVYTIFRNNLYLDILPWFFGEKVLETGIFLPAGETKAALTLREDMAEAIANVLITDGHSNQTYALSNTENVSMSDIANSLSEIVGKHIPYTNPATELYVETLKNVNVPNEFIGMFTGFSEAIKQGEFELYKTDLEKLLGRKPISAKQYLASVYQL